MPQSSGSTVGTYMPMYTASWTWLREPQLSHYFMPLCHRNNKHITMHGLRQWLCNGPTTKQSWPHSYPSETVQTGSGFHPGCWSMLTGVRAAEMCRRTLPCLVWRLRKNGYILYTPPYAVAQLVEALCHKPEGRGFVSQWCNWNFSLS
jgi:hypothetical protein